MEIHLSHPLDGVSVMVNHGVTKVDRSNGYAMAYDVLRMAIASLTIVMCVCVPENGGFPLVNTLVSS